MRKSILVVLLMVSTIAVAGTVNIVKLTHNYKGNLAGEEAGYSPAEAAAVVAKGYGTIVRTITSPPVTQPSNVNGFSVVKWSFVADADGAAEVVTTEPVYGWLSRAYFSPDPSNALDDDATATVVVNPMVDLYYSSTDVCDGDLVSANTASLTVVPFASPPLVSSRLKLSISGAENRAGTGASGNVYLIIAPTK